MINVVLAVIEHDEKILLIKRERGDFVGLYALPEEKWRKVSILIKR